MILLYVSIATVWNTLLYLERNVSGQDKPHVT